MSNRDLIAQGRAKLAAVAQNPTTDRALDLAQWSAINLRLLLDLWEIDRAELEAAQRLPLGYVVLIKRPLLVSGYRYAPVGGVEPDAEFLAYRKTHHPLSDGEYVFAEVREVQP